MTGVSTTKLLLDAYAQSWVRQSEVFAKWVSVSHKFPPVGNPNLMSMVQAVGKVDCLNRELEDEYALRRQNENLARELLNEDVIVVFAELWLLRAYELVRLSVQNLGNEAPEELVRIKRLLTLSRVPVAKGEIAGESRHKGDIIISRGDSFEAAPYVRDSSFIPPRTIYASSGSVCWHGPDLRSAETVVISRRDLSDRLLELFP